MHLKRRAAGVSRSLQRDEYRPKLVELTADVFLYSEYIFFTKYDLSVSLRAKGSF